MQCSCSTRRDNSGSRACRLTGIRSMPGKSRAEFLFQRIRSNTSATGSNLDGKFWPARRPRLFPVLLLPVLKGRRVSSGSIGAFGKSLRPKRPLLQNMRAGCCFSMRPVWAARFQSSSRHPAMRYWKLSPVTSTSAGAPVRTQFVPARETTTTNYSKTLSSASIRQRESSTCGRSRAQPLANLSIRHWT